MRHFGPVGRGRSSVIVAAAKPSGMGSAKVAWIKTNSYEQAPCLLRASCFARRPGDNRMVRLSFRSSFYIALALALTLGLYLTWLWQPERQIDRHTQHLLRRVEHRDWAGLSAFLAEDY